MLAAALSVYLLAQAGAAGAGARPAECAPLSSATASNVWERAKYPALRQYCDLLASGAAKLSTGASPEEAREAIAKADEASRVLPGHAAPDVLRGRALVALGQWRDALAALEGANVRDPHALDDPAALLAWGRALGRARRLADAEAALRSLLPRGAALAPADQGRAEIEAGLLAEARGAAGLDDAIALFRQASLDAQDSLQVLAGMALALALDRAGEGDEARAAVGSARRDPRGVAEDPAVLELLDDVGQLGEKDALVAFSLAERDASGARELWASYLTGPGGTGPWAAHARSWAEGGARRARGGGGKATAKDAADRGKARPR